MSSYGVKRAPVAVGKDGSVWSYRIVDADLAHGKDLGYTTRRRVQLEREQLEEQEPNSLQHWGILGMHWGIRRTPEQLGHTSKSKKEKTSGSADGADTTGQSKSVSTSSKVGSSSSEQKDDASDGKSENTSTSANSNKSVSELTDKELKAKVDRMDLEKRYNQNVAEKEKASSYETELKATVDRMNLEKQYRELVAASTEKTTAEKGKEWIADVLSKSGKKVLGDILDYSFGTMVNSLVGEKVVKTGKDPTKDDDD